MILDKHDESNKINARTEKVINSSVFNNFIKPYTQEFMTTTSKPYREQTEKLIDTPEVSKSDKLMTKRCELFINVLKNIFYPPEHKGGWSTFRFTFISQYSIRLKLHGVFDLKRTTLEMWEQFPNATHRNGKYGSKRIRRRTVQAEDRLRSFKSSI